MTRAKYNESLDVLKDNVTNMGKLAHDAINNSMKALKEIDRGLADSVITADKVIDHHEMEIERSVSQIIALQNPTAGDMRFVTSCLKIAIDIERMSDLAVNIAEITKQIEGEHVKPLVDIPKMAEVASSMLEQTMAAFVNNDAELARSIAKRDDEIDRAFYRIEKELIEMMIEDESIITNASHLLFAIRYIERMGDHSCNICESIVYIANGERVDLN